MGKCVFSKEQDMYRITLTNTSQPIRTSLIYNSRAGKSQALKEVFEGKYKPDLYPSQVIFPVDGNCIGLLMLPPRNFDGSCVYRIMDYYFAPQMRTFFHKLQVIGSV